VNLGASGGKRGEKNDHPKGRESRDEVVCYEFISG
jgi:hypothetical protein